MDEDCKEEYLNSFCTKVVLLKDGKKLECQVALDQLLTGVISREDIVDEDGCNELVNNTSASRSPFCVPHNIHTDWNTSHNLSDVLIASNEDEQTVENAMKPVDYDDNPTNETDNEESSDGHSDWVVDQRQNLKYEQMWRAILTGNYDIDNQPTTPPLEFPSSSESKGGAMNMEDLPDPICRKTKRKLGCSLAKVTAPSTSTSKMAGDEESDANDKDKSLQTVKPGRLLMEAIQKAQALGRCTTEEAKAIVNEYGKTLATIMAAAGLSMKASWAELV
ncbi:hypothetical protein V8B97DRAFT_1874420 [Scleroderma yunnanense]